MPTRRRVLLGALATPIALIPAQGTAQTRTGTLSLAVLGQSLVRHDLRRRPWPGLEPLSKRLREHDACFTAFEVVVLGPRAGAPTRSDPETLHTADPVVIDVLRDFGVTFVATSGNHAFDVGTGGILDTMEALRARGMPFAGTGGTLAEAAAPTYQETPAGRFAVVAGAAGAIREGGAATAARPGVHELRRGASGGLDRSDVERMLDSIRSARREAQVVLAYLHNHLWERENWRTPEWQRELARACIDAGASLFVSHGPPLLHGLEMYRGAPLFHGLGSFIFQTRKAPDAYGAPNWQSLIAECRFEAGRFAGAELVPVQLAAVGENGHEDLETRGRPSLATPPEAAAILARLGALSADLGYTLRADGAKATLSA